MWGQVPARDGSLLPGAADNARTQPTVMANGQFFQLIRLCFMFIILVSYGSDSKTTLENADKSVIRS